MKNGNINDSHIPYCDFVPGYGYYNIVDDNLAGGLYNLIERLLEFLASIRKYQLFTKRRTAN
jgi:hypothetical protein